MTAPVHGEWAPVLVCLPGLTIRLDSHFNPDIANLKGARPNDSHNQLRVSKISLATKGIHRFEENSWVLVRPTDVQYHLIGEKGRVLLERLVLTDCSRNCLQKAVEHSEENEADFVRGGQTRARAD